MIDVKEAIACWSIRYSGERTVDYVVEECRFYLAVVENGTGVRSVQPVTPDAVKSSPNVGR